MNWIYWSKSSKIPDKRNWIKFTNKFNMRDRKFKNNWMKRRKKLKELFISWRIMSSTGFLITFMVRMFRLNRKLKTSLYSPFKNYNTSFVMSQGLWTVFNAKMNRFNSKSSHKQEWTYKIYNQYKKNKKACLNLAYKSQS